MAILTIKQRMHLTNFVQVIKNLRKKFTSFLEFLLKVYAILLFQLSITIIECFIHIFVPGLREFNLKYYWITFIIFVVSFVGMCFLFLFEKVYPVNFILMTLWVTVFPHLTCIDHHIWLGCWNDIIFIRFLGSS